MLFNKQAYWLALSRVNMQNACSMRDPLSLNNNPGNIE